MRTTIINLIMTCPRDAKQELDFAIEQAQEAITEARDAVEGLRASTSETNNLVASLNTLAMELAANDTNPSPPAFDLQVEGAPRDLQPILRDNVSRIASEALRNAFRHAQARRIEVKICYGNHQSRLRVRDDGKGIDSQIAADKHRPGHWGLQGMSERAKVIGGHLELRSGVKSGTEIELTIPASIAF
jgi:signal transduction histidine kinase